MNWHKTTLEISTRGKGLHDITETVRAQLREWNVQEGMCFLFLPHTSASLVMSENWDPTARVWALGSVLLLPVLSLTGVGT